MIRLRKPAALTALAVGVLIAAPAAGARAAAHADGAPGACSSVLLAGSAWLGGQGVAVESNGHDQGSGTSCGGTNKVGSITTGSKWQCAELVNRLYVTRGWISATWPGNGGRSSPAARDSMYDEAPGALSKQPNGSISYIGPGDVISINVYQNGTFLADGHVLIANATAKITSGSVPMISQNGGDATDAVVTSSGSLAGGTLTIPSSGSWSYSVIGVVHAPAPPATGRRAIGVGSSKGATQVFAIGTSGSDMYVNTQTTPGSAAWSGWQDIGGTWPAGDAIGVGSSDGATQVFAVGTTGSDMYVNTQTAPGSAAWSGWQDIGGTWPAGDAIAVGSSNGATQVFAVGTTGSDMYVDTEAGPGSTTWSGWQDIGGTWPAGDAIAVGSSDGATQVFAVGTTGSDMYVDTEAGPGSTTWSGWQDIGGTWPAGDAIAVGSSDGATQVFAVGTTGSDMYVNTQTAPGSAAWSGWQDIGGTWPAGDAIAVGSSDGATQVFAVGTTGSDMYTDTEAGPGSTTWSGWQDIGGTWPAGDAIAVGSSDGATQVFAIGTAHGGAMYTDTEAGPGSTTWSGWQDIGGTWPQDVKSIPARPIA